MTLRIFYTENKEVKRHDEQIETNKHHIEYKDIERIVEVFKDNNKMVLHYDLIK